MGNCEIKTRDDTFCFGRDESGRNEGGEKGGEWAPLTGEAFMGGQKTVGVLRPRCIVGVLAAGQMGPVVGGAGYRRGGGVLGGC